MRSCLACVNARCTAEFPISEVHYICPACGGLLEVRYEGAVTEPWTLKQIWRERRMSNHPLDQSGVWRYREMLPFLEDALHLVTLREGNTPILDGLAAARYAGVDRIQFKHQGFNPTGSFRDNGMAAGVSQAVRLGMKRAVCVSTGDTGVSMAAYAALAGLEPIILTSRENAVLGKLGQALDYGAKILQVEASLDEILVLAPVLAERLGLFSIHSENPFCVEGQKSTVIEMMDQLDWEVPDWMVVPGGHRGCLNAFEKGTREMFQLGLIDKLPQFAAIPTSGVDGVTEHEIADAKAVIGQCGISCDSASATTLAGVKKLVAAGTIRPCDQIVAVLTGNVFGGQHGGLMQGEFEHPPVVAPNDVDAIGKLLRV